MSTFCTNKAIGKCYLWQDNVQSSVEAKIVSQEMDIAEKIQ